MRLYLWLNDDKANVVHGVDYTKGLEQGQECGRVHEFHTRNCKPIVLTEEEVKSFGSVYKFVEIVPFRADKVHVDTDGTMREVVWGE